MTGRAAREVPGLLAFPANVALADPTAPQEAGWPAHREQLYRDLLNALPAAIYTTDAQGRITFYNEAAVELSGRRPRIGADEWCVTWRLFHLDGAPMRHDECPMAIALKEGRNIRGAEAWAERPDGSRVCFAPYPTVFKDGAGKVIGAVNMLVDITHRKTAEARHKLLANEVNHRANNLLGVVQATVRLSEAASVDELRASLEGRIGALAHAHDLLAKAGWEAADLHHLVSAVLAPHMGGPEARVWTTGPVVALDPKEAQSLAIVLHELATNAARFGALSAPAGRVLIEWRDSDEDGLSLLWREADGPAVKSARRIGLGGRMIRGAISQIGGGVEFAWPRDGLRCQIAFHRAAKASSEARSATT